MHSKDLPTLKFVIDSSSIPMYLIDQEGILTHCNDAYLALFMKTTEIIGSPVFEAISASLQYVPEDKKSFYSQQQEELGKKIFACEIDHADATIIFDFRKHQNQQYRNIYDVSIHVDRIHFTNSESWFLLGIMLPKVIS